MINVLSMFTNLELFAQTFNTEEIEMNQAAINNAIKNLSKADLEAAITTAQERLEELNSAPVPQFQIWSGGVWPNKDGENTMTAHQTYTDGLRRNFETKELALTALLGSQAARRHFLNGNQAFFIKQVMVSPTEASA